MNVIYFGCSWKNTKVDFSEGLIRGSILLVLHILDYLYYKFTGQNVGPCGLSEYTEAEPIVIKNTKVQDYFSNSFGSVTRSFTEKLLAKAKKETSHSSPAA